MARYFAGNSLASFNRTNSTITESTSTGFDSAVVGSSLQVVGGTGADYAESWAFNASGTLHWMFEFFQNSATISGVGPALYNGSTGVFRLRNSGATNRIQAEYWNGSAWTATGVVFEWTNNVRHRIYVSITLGSGFTAYLDGGVVTTGSGWSGGGTTVTNIRMYPLAGNPATATWYSQIMLADYNVQDSKLFTLAINGNSATNTGASSGVYTDINETPLNESTIISIGTAGNKAGFTKASLTVPSGHVIGAMVINARGRITGGTADGLIGVRSASTNYSGSGLGYTSSYGPKGRIISDDPATGSAFTQTNFNNAEGYLEAS
jgi:hypothetical protein